MKKFLGLAAGAAMIAGSLAAVGPAADAGTPSYPNTVPTTCRADNLNNPRVGQAAKVKFKATPSNGSGDPKGLVTFDYQKKNSKTITKEYTVRYVGPDYQKYAFKGIPAGRYKVIVHFDSRPKASVYKNCNTSFDQQVKKRR